MIIKKDISIIVIVAIIAIERKTTINAVGSSSKTKFLAHKCNEKMKSINKNIKKQGAVKKH
jgi:hypothetical protein